MGMVGLLVGGLAVLVGCLVGFWWAETVLVGLMAGLVGPNGLVGSKVGFG